MPTKIHWQGWDKHPGFTTISDKKPSHEIIKDENHHCQW